MEKQTLEVKFDDGKFWMSGEDEFGPYESEVTSWEAINTIANGFKFGIATKETSRSRKWQIRGQVTISIEAQLDLVKELLKAYYEVKVTTPDLEIIFFK